MTDPIDRIANALERIATALELDVMPDDADMECMHPVEQRIDFSAPGVVEFHCKACDTRVTRSTRVEN